MKERNIAWPAHPDYIGMEYLDEYGEHRQYHLTSASIDKLKKKRGEHQHARQNCPGLNPPSDVRKRHFAHHDSEMRRLDGVIAKAIHEYEAPLRALMEKAARTDTGADIWLPK